MLSNNQKNIATIIHLSTFSQYFFPFGNFILPIILWTLNKDKSEFVDAHGKQAINFQLSLLIYGIGISIIAVPIFLFMFMDSFSTEHIINHSHIFIDSPNWADSSEMIIFIVLACIIALAIFVLNIVLVITAASNANQGEPYKYPLTINFLK